MPEKASITNDNVVGIATGYVSMMAHTSADSNAFSFAATYRTTQCATVAALLTKE
jgi:hypothetical protein